MIVLAISIAACKKEETEPINKPITYHRDGDFNQLLGNDSSKINIVILGDGFIRDDLKIGGVFDSVTKVFTDYIFTIEPFKAYKSRFNIYVVYAESQDRGTDSTNISRDKNTALYSHLYLNNSGMVGITTDSMAVCNRYIAKVMPRSQVSAIVMLVNTPKFAGTAWGNFSIVTLGSYYKQATLHELGHAFGGLADEYIVKSFGVVEEGTWPLGNVNKYPNVDSAKTFEHCKWYKFAKYYPEIGMFEGGYYRTVGVYRPEENSIMRNLNAEYFNAPSREAIVKKIYGIYNQTYSFDEFLKLDTLNHRPNLKSYKEAILPPLNDFKE